MAETSFLLALAAALCTVLLIALLFYVVRLRREFTAFGERVGRIENRLAARSGDSSQPPAHPSPNDLRDRRIRACENCGRQNALQDVKCAACGELLQWDRPTEGGKALRVDHESAP